jgi:hypothetical protein
MRTFRLAGDFGHGAGEGGARESQGLETNGAVHEPVKFGEIVNEQGLGFGGGLVVGFEIGYEGVEGVGIFAFDQDLAGSEAMFERVSAGCGFAG